MGKLWGKSYLTAFSHSFIHSENNQTHFDIDFQSHLGMMLRGMELEIVKNITHWKSDKQHSFRYMEINDNEVFV
jgi:hypothetical protein